MAEPGRSAGITGIGVVSPLGAGIENLWEGLLRGEPASAPTPRTASGVILPPRACTLAGRGWALEEFGDARRLRRLSRFSAMASIAARQAAEQAGLANAPEAAASSRESSSAVLGTSFGSSVYHFEYYQALFLKGLGEASPLLFSESVLNAASGHITQQQELRGPGLTLVGGEDVGLQAFSMALDLLRRGGIPFAIAGGAEEYCDILHAALAAVGRVAGEPGKPFAALEQPCLLGEGATLAVLEGAAASRPPIALLLGSGSGRRRFHEDAGRGVERAVREALLDARVDAGSIDGVVSGACGASPDAAEIAGLARVLDPRKRLWFVAPKRLLGEAFGFTSAAQAAVAALILERGIIPPTGWNGEKILPPAWQLPERPLETRAAAVLAIATARSGAATALVLGKAS